MRSITHTGISNSCYKTSMSYASSVENIFLLSPIGCSELRQLIVGDMFEGHPNEAYQQSHDVKNRNLLGRLVYPKQSPAAQEHRDGWVDMDTE